MTDQAPALGYYWGDDDYALDRAVDRLAQRMAVAADAPIERWRTRGDETTNAALLERVGTSPFFGGGTLVVVSAPAGLARAKSERPSLLDVLASVAPGNGLAFLDPVDAFGKRSAAGEALGEAVRTAGGEAREFKSPKEGQMVRWIEEQATERGVRMDRGAAQELATRIGAFVREGDVDRRRQGRLAASELDKLALFRPEGAVTADDIRQLVPEAIPGSMWALLDAIATRQAPEAIGLLERLVESTPPPVLLTSVHRRIRELIMAGDLVASGATPPEIVRTLKMKPYPAEKLEKQSRNWTAGELEAALDGLVELDAAIKGSDGAVATDGQVRLAWAVWIADFVRRTAPRMGAT
jgi:DNA polymerase III delta subunit